MSTSDNINLTNFHIPDNAAKAFRLTTLDNKPRQFFQWKSKLVFMDVYAVQAGEATETAQRSRKQNMAQHWESLEDTQRVVALCMLMMATENKYVYVSSTT